MVKNFGGYNSSAVIGLLLDDWIDAHLYNGFVVAIMLILVGVAFIYVENRNKDMRPSVDTLFALSYKDALIIGLFQVVAPFYLELQDLEQRSLVD